MYEARNHSCRNRCTRSLTRISFTRGVSGFGVPLNPSEKPFVKPQRKKKKKKTTKSKRKVLTRKIVLPDVFSRKTFRIPPGEENACDVVSCYLVSPPRRPPLRPEAS